MDVPKAKLWQPLSLHALSEYTQKIAPPGDGDFKHGRTPIWTVATAR